jgi:hypothetical protein
MSRCKIDVKCATEFESKALITEYRLMRRWYAFTTEVLVREVIMKDRAGGRFQNWRLRTLLLYAVLSVTIVDTFCALRACYIGTLRTGIYRINELQAIQIVAPLKWLLPYGDQVVNDICQCSQHTKASRTQLAPHYYLICFRWFCRLPEKVSSMFQQLKKRREAQIASVRESLLCFQPLFLQEFWYNC